MPTPKQAISEHDVLVAAALWLHARGVLPVLVSVAVGQGIHVEAAKRQVLDRLTASGVALEPSQFTPTGPDFIGLSKSEFWQVECKGAGTGVQSTQRNNFDRALASVVSYFGEPPPDVPDEDYAAYRNGVPHLGLALPATPDYLRELRRVRQPLREALNLWVLLYKPQTQSITPVSPDSEFPNL